MYLIPTNNLRLYEIKLYNAIALPSGEQLAVKQVTCFFTVKQRTNNVTEAERKVCGVPETVMSFTEVCCLPPATEESKSIPPQNIIQTLIHNWCCNPSSRQTLIPFPQRSMCTMTVLALLVKMWPAQHKSGLRRKLTKLRLMHHQIANLLLIRMVLLFFQSDFPVQSYEPLNANNTQVDLDRTRYL